MGVGIFSDCIFFLKVNSLSLKEKKKLKNSITLNGGEVSFVLNNKCTHAVVSNPDILNSSQQKKIEKYLISLVDPDFIWKSVQEERPDILVDRLDDNKTLEITGDGNQDCKKNQFQERRQKLSTKETLHSNLEEDMEFEDNENDNIPEDTEVAKYCCFKKDKEYAIVELLCLSKQGPFPFRISTVCGSSNTSQKELTFHLVDTAEKACEKYEHRINDMKNKGFTQINKIPLQAENLASKALQKVLLGEAINIAELSPEVAGLVESMWVDAVGHLDAILSCPVENISLNDLSKAEGILRQVRNALVKKDREEDISRMMQEFYRCLPHKEKRPNNINMKFLTVKQDLCQVIRDMINVCETSLSQNTPSSTAKYQALRCRIEYVDPNSEEFHQVKKDILDHNHSNREFNILRVLRVGRMSEANNFKSDVGNVRPLLHASSPCNFVGILSRGLMMPKIIVEEFGGERTDIGNLGSGIYFSDSISTSIKYSQPSDTTGSRLLVICDVALGKCKDVFHRNYTITEAPNGFDSVHGVQQKEGVKSDFTDDEYVVYDVSQVRMRYVVQFSTDGDYVDLQKESLYISIDQAPDHCKSLPEASEDASLEELPEQQVMKGGLKGSDGQQIPLESIHVKARLMDLAAQVVIFQTYKNNSTFPIEAKYVFPLDSTAAVCGFEAFINGKHIIGEVKEKQKAHQEYRTAISEGHGAYLMDQDAPDIFTVSVGNLPSKATVVIKITYVMELSHKYDCIEFSIPGNVAEWQQDKALKENTQDTVAKVGIGSDMTPGGSFCLDMSIEMPRKIDSISSYTHEIKIKRTECKAVVQTKEASSFNDQGFIMVISLENFYIPRMWVEKHPDQDSEACMLIFQPDIPYNYDDVFLTICLDCSNSMESCFQSAKQVALLALRSLSYRYVNVVLFGSSSKEFYVFPKLNLGEDMETFIKKAKPTMGSTEFWKVLQCLSLLKPKMGPQKIFLISDGHVQNEHLVFQILSKHKKDIQLFTAGVGTTANKHMLRCFAQYGSGTFEYFADKSKSRWKDQMEKQSNRLNSSACTAVSVKWRQFNENPSELLQAPANIQAIFSTDSLFVYGFVPYCTQATLKALVDNEELENMVSTTELQKTTGTMLHTLTARALVKDYEDGILFEKENENEMKKQEMKSSIIQLSIEYSIVTQFTSFVAVEKRSAEEDIDIEPNVLEIISAENVDILPYMDWSSTADKEEDVVSDDLSEALSTPLAYEEACCDDVAEIMHGGEVSEALSTTVTTGQSQISVPDESVYSANFLRRDTHKRRVKLLCKELRKPVRSEEEEEQEGFFNEESASASFEGLELFVEKSPEVRTKTWKGTSYSLALEKQHSFQFGKPGVFSDQGFLGQGFLGQGFSMPQGPPGTSGVGLGQLGSSPSVDSLSFKKVGSHSESYKPTADVSAPSMAPCYMPMSPQAAAAFGGDSSYSALDTSRILSAPRTPQGFSDKRPTFSALNLSTRNLMTGSVVSPSVPPQMPIAAPRKPMFGFGVSDKSSAMDIEQQPESALSFPELLQTRAQIAARVSSLPFGSAAPIPSLPSYQSGFLPPPRPMTGQRSSSLFGSITALADIPRLPGSQIGVPPPPPPMVRGSSRRFGSAAQIQRLPSFQIGVPPLPPPPAGGSSSLFDAPYLKSKFIGSLPVVPPPPPPEAGGSSSLFDAPYLKSKFIGSLPVVPPPPPPEAGGSSSLFDAPYLKSKKPSFQHLFSPSSPPPVQSSHGYKLASIEIRTIDDLAEIPAALPPMISETKPEEFLSARFLKKTRIQAARPSWSSLSSLQSQEGFWLLNQELGTLLKINVTYFTTDFLVKKGITSLGARGIDSVQKLIATLLVLQIIRAHNILHKIKFKTLMKLDPSIPTSSLYPGIEKAIEWVVKSDRQYPGICMRLGLGKDWDQATRQLLGLDPISTTSDLYSVSEFLFLP
ncbi:protein mono-ADP-ribosyltransferase PARP4 isoform X5 [Dendrobates tinctorius]|uniref:protein mono-ADP-ribosyltransferase PARP4 isoform X5 n=1 Tax=Dendrobates tinctorius TaxID=92724 RepID=UPI003CC9F768